MPNFHTKTFIHPLYPCSFGKSRFDSIALCQKGEKLILSHCQGQELLLKINETQNGFLIKGDKITRPSNVAILQQALQDFRDLAKMETTSSNIEHKKIKSLEISPYFKTMEYFSNNFETTKDILVEVGFGSGRHLLHQAKLHPDKIMIGLEIHKPSIEQVLKQCELQNIKNILIVNYDARAFLEFLPSNSVNQIFVHFPVPWDKKPHRRVISDVFINESKRVLRVDGSLELRTDSDNYFEYSFSEFMKQSKVDLHVKKNKDLEISSKYEDRWKKQEKNIYDITMINKEHSQDVSKIGTLSFEENISFKDVNNRFKDAVLRGEDFFAHTEEIFQINENEGLLRVSFGGSHRNERNYIRISNNKATYLPDTILATKYNLRAHELIKELIYGI